MYFILYRRELTLRVAAVSALECRGLCDVAPAKSRSGPIVVIRMRGRRHRAQLCEALSSCAGAVRRSFSSNASEERPRLPRSPSVLSSLGLSEHCAWDVSSICTNGSLFEPAVELKSVSYRLHSGVSCELRIVVCLIIYSFVVGARRHTVLVIGTADIVYRNWRASSRGRAEA